MPAVDREPARRRATTIPNYVSLGYTPTPEHIHKHTFHQLRELLMDRLDLPEEDVEQAAQAARELLENQAQGVMRGYIVEPYIDMANWNGPWRWVASEVSIGEDAHFDPRELVQTPIEEAIRKRKQRDSTGQRAGVGIKHASAYLDITYRIFNDEIPVHDSIHSQYRAIEQALPLEDHLAHAALVRVEQIKLGGYDKDVIPAQVIDIIQEVGRFGPRPEKPLRGLFVEVNYEGLDGWERTTPQETYDLTRGH